MAEKVFLRLDKLAGVEVIEWTVVSERKLSGPCVVRTYSAPAGRTKPRITIDLVYEGSTGSE